MKRRSIARSTGMACTLDVCLRLLTHLTRYIMSMAVADWSGQAWLQGFNDAGLAVFGKTADEVMEIKVGTTCTLAPGQSLTEVVSRNVTSPTTTLSWHSQPERPLISAAVLNKIPTTSVDTSFSFRVAFIFHIGTNAREIWHLEDK